MSDEALKLARVVFGPDAAILEAWDGAASFIVSVVLAPLQSGGLLRFAGVHATAVTLDEARSALLIGLKMRHAFIGAMPPAPPPPGRVLS
jgi:hypothetical protein